MIAMLAVAAAFCVPGASPNIAATSVVEAYFDAHNRHDLDGIRRTISADAQMGRPGSSATGAEVIRRYEEIVFKRFPKVHTEMLDSVAAGDLVAQLERVTGISVEGETGLTVYRVNQGCIVEMSISQ